MRPIGFSHGNLFKVHDVYTPENISLLKACGSTAIELNCHHVREAELLGKILPFIQGFDYVSLHTPCDTRYGNNPETRDLLGRLEKAYVKAGAQLAVVHPDLVDDWSVFNGYAIEWAIENMDARKDDFKDVASLTDFFTHHPSWSLVLDVGHCNDIDKTMSLAEDLAAAFKDRIKEIHLSGYEVFHDPLHRTKQTEIIDCCALLDCPIIIESTFEISDGTEGIKKEFDYILSNLGR